MPLYITIEVDKENVCLPLIATRFKGFISAVVDGDAIDPSLQIHGTVTKVEIIKQERII